MKHQSLRPVSVLFLAVLVFSMLLSACAPLAAPAPATPAAPAAPTAAAAQGQAQEPATSAAPEGKKLNIAVIAKSMDNPAFQVAKKGAEDRIKELGGNINMEWTAPVGADPAKMVQMIESYVQKKVDGLMVDSLGPSVCQASLATYRSCTAVVLPASSPKRSEMPE